MPEAQAYQSLALEHGYRALLAWPLLSNKTDYGVLAFYSERPHVFALRHGPLPHRHGKGHRLRH